MSWKSGGYLFSSVVDVVDKNVASQEARVEIYERFIKEFSDGDCDTLEYALDEMLLDPWSLRLAFVNTGYWREYPEYGELICKTHYQHSPCPDC